MNLTNAKVRELTERRAEFNTLRRLHQYDVMKAALEFTNQDYYAALWCVQRWCGHGAENRQPPKNIAPKPIDGSPFVRSSKHQSPETRGQSPFKGV